MSSSESEEFFDMNTTTSMEEFFTEPPNRLKQFVLSNDVQKLKELIDRGASTCIPDNRGRVGIHHAIEALKKECFEVLMEAKDLRVNVQDFYGNTPLIYACSKPTVTDDLKHMVNALLAHPEIDPFVKNNEQQTALHVSAFSGNFTFVKWLVRVGLDTDQPDVKGNPPIIHTLKSCSNDQNKIEIVKYLIKHGASMWSSLHNFHALDYCIPSTALSMTIINAIAQERLLDFVNFRQGSDHFMYRAALAGNYALVEKLLELGCYFSSAKVANPLNVLQTCGSELEMVELVYKHTNFKEFFKLEPPVLEKSSLWLLMKLDGNFHKKSYDFQQDFFPSRIPYTKWTLLTNCIASFHNPLDSKTNLIRYLLSKPDCIVSEVSCIDSSQVMPPLIAPLFDPTLDDTNFSKMLDLIRGRLATVRSRHCFVLLLPLRVNFPELVRLYLSKEVFYLDDIFEDDLSILFKVLDCNHDVLSMDTRLCWLLRLRLQFSPIRSSKLIELHHNLKDKLFQDSLEVVENALACKGVQKLQDLARLTLKQLFGFFEEKCSQYLKEMDVPNCLIDYVIKGNVYLAKMHVNKFNT